MKKRKLSIFITVVILLGGIVYLLSFAKRFFDNELTEVARFDSREEAITAGALGRGWLPQFLPQSAVRICEQHIGEDNHVLVSFYCGETDMKELIVQMKALPLHEFDRIKPRWLSPNAACGSPEIATGDLSNLQKGRWELYVVGSDAPKRVTARAIHRWYVLLNRESRRLILWS